MPKLKGISFETAIIKRYHHRKSGVEEALEDVSEKKNDWNNILEP